MINVPLTTIIQKIRESSDLTEQQIRDKIKDKLDQLSGLISEEGAAHIIANELGIKLYEPSGKLQIKNILAGQRNVEILGKVQRKFDVNEFDTGERKGKVGSFLIADETGMIRVVLWNDMVDKLSEINEGDVIKVKSGYVRENNNRKEVHLNDKSVVEVNPEGESVGKVKTEQEYQRKKISELQGDERDVELLGTIVQAFDPRFFEVCPKCSKRVHQKEDGFYCNEHGKVEPVDSYVTNVFLDDGSDNIRVVFWRNQAQKLFNKTHEEIIEMKESSFEELKNDLLGNIIKVVGRATKNEVFNRVEFVPSLVFTNPDPEEEMKRLENEPKEEIKQEETVSESEQKEETVNESSRNSDVRMNEEQVEESVSEPEQEVNSQESNEEVKVSDSEELPSIDDLEKDEELK
jgi:ssDNA-binding replication factor A large subunit